MVRFIGTVGTVQAYQQTVPTVPTVPTTVRTRENTFRNRTVPYILEISLSPPAPILDLAKLYTLNAQDCVNKLFQKSVLHDCISMCFDIITINIRVSIWVRGLHLVFFQCQNPVWNFHDAAAQCNWVSADRIVIAASRLLSAAATCIIQVFFAAGHRKSHWSGCIKAAIVMSDVSRFCLVCIKASKAAVCKRLLCVRACSAA